MKNKRLSLFLLGSVILAGASSASAQSFSFAGGDLEVSTYGFINSAPLADGAITPITIQQFSLPTATSITAAGTLQLPTTGTGGQFGIVGEYGSSSEGTLEVSGNGQYLTIGGYDGNAAANGIQAASNSANGTNFTPGTAWGGSTIALAQSADTDVPRSAAVITLATASVDTSTIWNDVYNTNNTRDVYSPDGSSLLISGQGAGVGDEGGIYSTTKGTNTTTGGTAPTPIFNVVSTRTIDQSTVNASTGGTSASVNTYYSADQNSKKKGTQTGIFEYLGTPTSSQGSSTGIRITPASNGLSGNALVSYSPEDFTFVSPTVLYVADTGDPKAGGTGDGGIQKWIYSGGAWNLAYTLTPSNFVPASQATSVSDGETGFEAMTLQVVGNNVDIYAVSYTAGDADPNGLYAVVDNLSDTTASQVSGEAFTELAAAPGVNGSGSDENFKGVALLPASVPEPSTCVGIFAGLGLIGAMRRRRSA